MITLTSYQTTIILPNPEWNDSEQLVGAVTVKRSVDGQVYTYVKSKNDRRHLLFRFRLTRSKSLELKAFIQSYYSSVVSLTDHEGQRWIGNLLNNPFEFEAISGEEQNIQLKFEGNKQGELPMIDISSDTNLSVVSPIVLTDDTLSFAHLGIESLTDPDADRILFWDDDQIACKWLTVSTGLQIVATSLTTKDSEIVHGNLSGGHDLTTDIDHDTITNYVANEHIDHTSVTLIAGSGITGGGTIAVGRTFDLDINSLAAAGIAGGDFVPFWDITAAATNKKITFANFEAALTHGSLIDGHNLTTDIDHDTIDNYVANQHINWTAATDNFVTTGNITCRNSGSDIATLGSELVTNGTFVSDLANWTIGDGGAEWVWDATGKADHAIGNISTFLQAIVLTNTETYYVEFTVSGRTAGSVVLTFGALVGSYTASANGTYQCSFRATATANFNLTFTPTNPFDGMLDDVTVKQITGTSGSIVTLEDNTGADAVEIRSSNALQNIFIGRYCGYYNMVGDYNTALGYEALYNNTTGQNNFALGTRASYSNTTGENNVAIGYRASYLGTIGDSNVAIGYEALYYNATGSRNMAVGNQALLNNTTGTENIAIGYSALVTNTEGSNNTAIGGRALYENTTAAAVDNTAVGYAALYANTTGYRNTAVGGSALQNSTEGFENTAIGHVALPNITTGDKNTAIGRFSGAGITTGNKNTIIGAYVQGLAAALSNHIIIADGDGNQRIVVDDNGDVGIGTFTPHYPLTVNGGIAGLEKSTDPAEPAEGEYVIWMSDGTGKGDDGDVMIASKAAGQTNVGTLFDHSGGAAW